ncbi:MAG: xanthine dehydrogenase accessory factor [Solirubrobacteraceae bacterium]|nr:xanthine dehydrogenase accessory factor [Solirubrobacteraceae bacterium]
MSGDGPTTPQGAFAELARASGRGALVTVMRSADAGVAVGARMLVRPDGSTEGALGDDALERAAVAHADELMWAERSEAREEGGALLFVDAVFPSPRLVIFGAIDFAAQLCTLARTCGFRPYVVDPRAFFARQERFPDAEEVIATWPDAAFERLGGIDRAMAIAVLTHDPKLDDAALSVALRSPAGYVGAMGSTRTQKKRRERLLAAGLTDGELERLAAPIGLDLGSVTPQETALSIMSEIVAVRRGREGGRLVAARRRVQEVAT